MSYTFVVATLAETALCGFGGNGTLTYSLGMSRQTLQKN
jgi:hypothetical protein